MFQITPISNDFDQAIVAKINNKTKPLGALGALENVAKKLASIYANKRGQWVEKIEVSQPWLAVFAGDHGIAAHGVSIAPSEVTQQMVLNFAQGGAAINVFTRQFGWQLSVVDAGILVPVPEGTGVIAARLGNGTNAIHEQDAMSQSQVLAGFEMAKKLVQEKVDAGSNLVAFGEMGIGNTSSASALMSVILGISAEQSVGRGTGVTDDVLAIKTTLVQQAVDRAKAANPQGEPLQLLAQLGGFEIVQICGAMLAAAETQTPIIVDGFICTAAAMVAKLIDPNVADYFIFAHHSGEQGHHKMLAWFDATPLLSMGLRLGEGTGAALSLPMIQASAAFYNEMASFEAAQVENVVENENA